MKRVELLFFLIVSLMLLAFGRSIGAQELYIDENGNTFVRLDGEVLGETSVPSNNSSDTNDEDIEDDEDSSAISSSEDDEEDDDSADSGTNQQTALRGGSSTKRVELEGDRLRVKIKPQDNGDDDNDEEASRPAQRVETIRIKEHKNKTEVVIRTSDDGVEIEHGKVRVRTNFPITIGPENELMITTPAGTKTVTVLPDAAMKNLLQKGFPVITPTPMPTPGEGTDSAELEEPEETTQETEVTIIEDDGTLVYKAKAKKEKKLLGLIPVEGTIEAQVSAETGQVVEYNEPWYFRFFGFLYR